MSDTKVIEKAVRVLRKGGVILFPTDTVWGIGASVAAPLGLRRLYAVKGRSHGKPTVVLVDSLEMAKQYGVFDARALTLAETHWPGALTLIIATRKDTVPALVRGRGATVGLRIPKHQLTQEIIHKLGAGIAAGSANLSGDPAPLVFSDIQKRLLEDVDYVVYPSTEERVPRSERKDHMASTVVDTTVTPVRILRRGPINVSTGTHQRRILKTAA